jgi:hypothetical protein
VEIVVTVISDFALMTPGTSLIQQMENARQAIAPHQRAVIEFLGKHYPDLVYTKSSITPTVVVYLEKDTDKEFRDGLLTELRRLDSVKSAECTGQYAE